MPSLGLPRLHGWGRGRYLSLACRRSFGPLMNLSLDSSNRSDHPSLVWIGCALARPWPQAASMVWFDDSDDFLLSPQAFDFPFYVVCVEQQGVSGLDLIRLIRRRSSVGILAISNLKGNEFVAALEAGADMVLCQDVPEDHFRAAIHAIRRRSEFGAQAAPHVPWRLLEAQAILQAPDGYADIAGGQRSGNHALLCPSRREASGAKRTDR